MIDNMNRQVICWNKTFTTHIAHKRSVLGVFQSLSKNKEKMVISPFLLWQRVINSQAVI